MLKVGRFQIGFFLVATASLVLVAFLRFTQLGSIPEGLTKDEAYYGIDANSILHTGRDIWGEPLPLFFKSTGEYKMNLTYFIVPAINYFGLSEFAVRLPSAVFGFATLIVLFMTIQIIFKQRYLSLFAVFIYALSPFPFGMSRLFYESNVGMFFLASGLYFLLSSRFVYAAPLFAIAAYLYNPFRYIGLAVLIVSILLYYTTRSRVTHSKPRPILLSLVLYLAVISPLFIYGPTGSSLERLRQEMNIRTLDYQLRVDEDRGLCYLFSGSPSLAKLCYPFLNKGVLHVNNVGTSFVGSLSPSFLFFDNDNEYIIPPYYGVLHSILLPFYVLGLIWLLGFIKLGEINRYQRYILLSTLIMSVAVVVSTGNIGLYRHSILVYLALILSTVGLHLSYQKIKQYPLIISRIFIVLLISISIFQVTKYLISYFTYTYKHPILFSYDIRPLFDYIKSHRDYDYLVDRVFFGPATAAFLWQIDPTYFQQNIVWTPPDKDGFINAARMDNFYVNTYTIEQLLCEKNKNPDIPLRALVLDTPGKYRDFADLITYDFSGSLALHAIYDIDNLYPHVLRHYPGDLCKVGGK